MRPGRDHDPDPRIHEALQLRGSPLDRAARLHVRVEQVAGDEDEIDLLRQREVHRRDEGGKLPLALHGGPITEVRVAGPEVHVGRVEQSRRRL